MATDEKKKEITGLLREVKKLFNQEDQPDSFTLERLKSKARELRKLDDVGANFVLARVAAVEGAVSQMRASHQLIIAANPRHPGVYNDYAQSLRKMGFYSEAREQAETAYRIFPEDFDYLQTLIKTCLTAGRVRQAWELLGDAMTAQAPIYIKQVNFLNMIHPFITEHNLQDVDLERLQQAAMAFLHSRNLYPVGILRAPAVHMEILANPVSNLSLPASPHPILRWGIQTRHKGEELGDLNLGLAAAVAAAGVPEMVTEYVKLRFIPFTPGGFSPTGFYF